ncbi:MAG: hypothetical protein J6X30_01725 [Clostridia bacterium]|nr:hypothetical protein [Clostridia bacterium]
MARCPYLENKSEGEFYCIVSKQKMPKDKLEDKCNPDYGKEYMYCLDYITAWLAAQDNEKRRCRQDICTPKDR